MKTILELEVNPQQERLLKEILTAMSIDFKSHPAEEKGYYSENEIKETIESCFGIWKDRNDFSDFDDFRKQAWGGRGV